jgi:hypothetical protein
MIRKNKWTMNNESSVLNVIITKKHKMWQRQLKMFNTKNTKSSFNTALIDSTTANVMTFVFFEMFKLDFTTV